MAEHIANPWAGPSVIGQNAAFSGHPPLAARLVASRPARCESHGVNQRMTTIRPLRANAKLDARMAAGSQRVSGSAWCIEGILAALALRPNARLRALVVETTGEIGNLADPIGGDLGHVRILRISPMTPTPPIC